MKSSNWTLKELVSKLILPIALCVPGCALDASATDGDESIGQSVEALESNDPELSADELDESDAESADAWESDEPELSAEALDESGAESAEALDSDDPEVSANGFADLQAHFLMLTARKSDLELQLQYIRKARADLRRVGQTGSATDRKLAAVEQRLQTQLTAVNNAMKVLKAYMDRYPGFGFP